MSKKEELLLKDSAVPVWEVGFAKPVIEEKTINTNDINDIFDKHLYSFNDFKFNRNEANNHE